MAREVSVHVYSVAENGVRIAVFAPHTVDVLRVRETIRIDHWQNIPIVVVGQVLYSGIARRQQFVQNPSCRRRSYPLTSVDVRL